MRREPHVRFCERPGVKLPRATHVGERVTASVGRFLTMKLRLKVNEVQSAVTRPEERKFLGFIISRRGERRIALKALHKFKVRIREIMCWTRGLSLSQIIEELAPIPRRVVSYFGFCQTPRVLTNLGRVDPPQWENGHDRFKEPCHRVVSQFSAALAADSPTGY